VTVCIVPPGYCLLKKLFGGFDNVALEIEFHLDRLAVFHRRTRPDAIFTLHQSADIRITLGFDAGFFVSGVATAGVWVSVAGFVASWAWAAERIERAPSARAIRFMVPPYVIDDRSVE
jgi:hypothetical protein